MPHDTTSRTFRCPSKVNLALSVGSPRADGYHPIASWMVAIDLYDDLVVTPLAANRTSVYAIDWATDAPRRSPIDWPLKSDLAVRAHQLIEQHVGRSLPVRMRLAKRIPAGAGLAGGSSDGAGMLRAINDVFDLQLPTATLVELAMQLGSDLGFFFAGGSALVTGRGEHIEPAPLIRPIHLLLLLPELACPTGAVYRAFDELSPNATVDEVAVRRLATGWHGQTKFAREEHTGKLALAHGTPPLDPASPFNDLASPAEVVEPRLCELRRRCADLIARPVHITGSGAGMFAIAADHDDARHIAQTISSQINTIAALAVQTATRG